MKIRTSLTVVALACVLVPAGARAADAVTVTAIDGAKIMAGSSGTASSTVDFGASRPGSAKIHFSDIPVCDPWDRLFSVTIDGVEILRGTTPRTTFSVTQDVSRYASLFSGTHTVTAFLANYWEAQYSDCGTRPADSQNQWHQVTVSFELSPCPSASTCIAATSIAAPWSLASLSPPPRAPLSFTGISSTHDIVTPGAASGSVTFLAYLTGHGNDEDWFTNTDPLPLRPFHLLLDGKEIATWEAYPYTYAFVGSVGGEKPSPLGPSQHELMWWTAQRALNENARGTGVGVIPPYEFDVSSAFAGITPGSTHSLEFKIDGGDSYWVFSGELLFV